MQRTVYSTRFTYVKNTINPDNTITAEIATIDIPETDEKRALKKAHKKIGYFAPIKTEKIGQLWLLDDEIFFKYAKPVDTTETAEGDTTETAEGDTTETAEGDTTENPEV